MKVNYLLPFILWAEMSTFSILKILILCILPDINFHIVNLACVCHLYLPMSENSLYSKFVVYKEVFMQLTQHCIVY